MPNMPTFKSLPFKQPFNKLWRSFLTTAGTKQFFYTFAPWVKWLSIMAGLFLVLGSVGGLLFAPPDYLQGNSYRIIFVHVPLASLAMSIYFAMAVCAVSFLVWKVKTASLLAQAIAPIGFWACVLSLITGSIWAKPTWGTYWVWDARLTSMLILAFLYAGVMALFSAFEHTSNRGKAPAILSIIGVVNLPIIKYSVEWWNTLHQPASFSVQQAPKMPADMWLPLLFMIVGGYLLAGALAIVFLWSLFSKRLIIVLRHFCREMRSIFLFMVDMVKELTVRQIRRKGTNHNIQSHEVQ